MRIKRSLIAAGCLALLAATNVAHAGPLAGLTTPTIKLLDKLKTPFNDRSIADLSVQNLPLIYPLVRNILPTGTKISPGLGLAILGDVKPTLKLPGRK